MQPNPYQAPSLTRFAQNPYRDAHHLPNLTPSRGAALVWIKGALAVLAVVGFAAGGGLILAGAHSEAIMALGIATLVVGYLAWFASNAVSIGWVYMMWDSLPHELRANYKRVHSPMRSALYLLIPYFNLYWMFVVSSDLIRAVNRGAEHMSTRRVPEAWGILSPIVQLTPCANILVAPFTWTAMMFQVQGAKDDLAAAMRAHAYGDPRASSMLV